MSLESFKDSQNNDIQITDNPCRVAMVNIIGIICVKSRGRSVTQSTYLPVIPHVILRSYVKHLHLSPKWYHQNEAQITKHIVRDFYIYNRQVISKEV